MEALSLTCGSRGGGGSHEGIGPVKYTQEQLQDFIDAIREHASGSGLTSWESDFVDSVEDQLQARGRLSDRQIEILDRIYAERTP